MNEKIAIIGLPINNIPIDSPWMNLHYYWKPPEIVIEFWSLGCKVEYIDDVDYKLKKEIILNSYNECINQHFREFVY